MSHRSQHDVPESAKALRAHQSMGPGHEFDTIRMLMTRWGPLAVDIGDDAAVLPATTDCVNVVSTDACVEGVHFRRVWITPYEIGVRAAAAAFSDLAAMGARADAALIAMVVPDRWRDALPDIADGIGLVVGTIGAKIIGGNLSDGDAFSITTTVFGSATRIISRNGAQVGDAVVVTGSLGGPGSAISAWNAGREPSLWARGRFAQPMPRLAEGGALAVGGATSMMDISDGLGADIRHLAAASNVAIDVDASLLPKGPEIAADAAMVSGEEYELLATVPQANLAAILASWSTVSSRTLTVIGTVVDKHHGGILRVIGAIPREGNSGESPQRVENSQGHDHFYR